MATITLDERHFKVAEKMATELGKTPDVYIAYLIDAATETFDEILSPVRENFLESGTTEQELDEVVSDARKAIHQVSKAAHT